MFERVLAFMAAYLLGSISFAYLAGCLKGVDLRREGSGTLGARNVKRLVGAPAALAVLLLDMLKGAAAVFLAGFISEAPLSAMVGWLGVVCGHGWPLFLRFKGGKGLASSAGALLLISPLTLILEIAAGGCFFALTRNVYASAIIMIVLIPLILFLAGGDASSFFLSLPLSLVMLILHRKNIKDMALFSGGK